MTEHPLQKPLWDLEWAIHYATERAERADVQAAEAWQKVAELEQQLTDTVDSFMLESLAERV